MGFLQPSEVATLCSFPNAASVQRPCMHTDVRSTASLASCQPGSCHQRGMLRPSWQKCERWGEIDGIGECRHSPTPLAGLAGRAPEA
eukprot:scaffold106775_cov96-Phaeocystis_antarctica.AAC.2